MRLVKEVNTVRTITKKILIWMLVIGTPIFIIFYHWPKEISRTYSAMEYRDDEYRPVSLKLDLTIKKQLFSKHLIDGSIEIGGSEFEVSNHLVFTGREETDDGTMKIEDTSNPLKSIKDHLFGDNYEFGRRVIGYNGFTFTEEESMTIVITKDFKYLSAFRTDGENSPLNYIAPANNMNDVQEVSQILYSLP